MPISFDYISDVKMIFPKSIIIEIRGQYAYIHNDDAIIVSKKCGARLNDGKIPYVWLYENVLDKYVLKKLRDCSISYIIVRDRSIIESNFYNASYLNVIKPKEKVTIPIADNQKNMIESNGSSLNEIKESEENKRDYNKELTGFKNEKNGNDGLRESIVTLRYEQPKRQEKKCKNCKLYRRDECYGEKEICDYFEVAPGSTGILWQ